MKYESRLFGAFNGFSCVFDIEIRLPNNFFEHQKNDFAEESKILLDTDLK